MRKIVTIIRDLPANYYAIIDQSNRIDGFYDKEPWPSTPDNDSKFFGYVNEYNGEKVYIVREIINSVGVQWIQVQIKDKLLWTVKEAVKSLNYTKYSYKKISMLGKVKIANNNYDGMYLNHPYNAEWSTSLLNHDMQSINGKIVTVVGEAISKSGNKYLGFYNKNSLNWTKYENIDLANELPLISINGDINGMDTEQSKTVSVSIFDGRYTINAIGRIKVIGDHSAIEWPKHNLKLELYKDSIGNEPLDINFPGLNVSGNEFALNSNYNDATHSRNSVTGSIWKSIMESEDNLPNELKFANNFGIAIPTQTLVNVNGESKGLYDIDNWRNDKTFNIEENSENALAIMGNNGFRDKPDLEFNHHTKLDSKDFKLITKPKSILHSIDLTNDLIDVVNLENDEEFKKEIIKHIDLQNVIDYYLFVNLINGGDNIMNNSIWITYDGKKWYLNAFDFEESWNLRYTGKRLLLETTWLFNNGTNKLLTRIYENFQADIKERWFYLRAIILKESTLNKYFDDFFKYVGEKTIEFNQSILESPSKDITNRNQISEAISERLKLSDEFFGNFKNVSKDNLKEIDLVN